MSGKNKETRQDFPVRKISETLIDFAQPFVSIIDQNTTEEQIRSGFMIAVTVWNAVVFDAVSGNHKYYDIYPDTGGYGERLARSSIMTHSFLTLFQGNKSISAMI